MRRWDYILEGTSLLVPFTSGHHFLRIFLEVQNHLVVGRFPAVAGISCCRAAWGCTMGNRRFKFYNCSDDGLWRSEGSANLVRPIAARLLSPCGAWRLPRMYRDGWPRPLSPVAEGCTETIAG
mmetsp:Transcript_109059/g.352010  ORF Transcript_109059/g.352010 Transcript_109059/m.352010 type:complete len:123 (-) Transcript_109059:356-724(-)